MSNSTTSKTAGDSQAAKFAVVRLKPGDNLLGLFQLLIHNGFGEVSFVNNLTETIFPAIGGGKRAPSPEPAPAPKKDETTNVATATAEKSLQSSTDGADRGDTTKSGIEKDRISRYQPPPPRVPLPTRTVAAESRICPPVVEPTPAPKATSADAGVIGGELSVSRAKRTALDLNVLSQSAIAAPASAPTSLPMFATMPSSFLGLPTMPSLNTSAAAAAAIAALSEAATPPYSLANFFSPNNLTTTIPSAALIQPPTSGAIHQYSPALLAAAAAAAQQRQTATIATSSTASATVSHPRSPSIQALTSSISVSNRPQVPAQSNQASYPFQQHQFQLLTAQPRLAFPQPQTAKFVPQKSPPATSPGSSSNSSTQSSHHNRTADGPLSSSCAPMPPGCATTQLRQRGQRSYAEDPSLYVACRLCKNKIMGSRISNLTNHVRRHSSMKQFQCCYCDYTHNEMAKVRLHMLHNHKDKDSQPIDNLSPEMQASWDLLMKECFPDHCQQQQQASTGGSPPQQQTAAGLTNTGVASLISQHLQLQCQAPSASAVAHLRGELSLQQVAYNQASQLHRRLESASNGSIEAVSPHDDKNLDANLRVLVQRRETGNSNNASPASSASTSSIVGVGGSLSPQAASPPVNQQAQLPQQFVVRCIECGLYVNAKLKARHIRKCHLQCLLPFVCSMCGYDHSEHSKVKVHICLKHDDDPMAQVITRDVSTYAEQLVPEYFPVENGVQYAANVLPLARRDSSEPVARDSACYATTHQRASAEVHASARSKTDSVVVCTQPSANHSPRVGQKKRAGLLACGVCRQIVRPTRAVRHARKHLSASRAAFVCSICSSYRTNSRTRMRRHLQWKHAVSGTIAKPPVSKRAATAAASSDGITSRALRRCFPAGNTTARIAKTVIRRYRAQPRKSAKCLRKRTTGNLINGRQQSREPRNALIPGRSRSKPLAAKPANGLRAVPSLMTADNPVIKTELRTVSEMNANPAPTDLLRMCPLCARWIRSDHLTAHLQSHVPAMGASYGCNLCDYTASDGLLVRAHFVQEHQKVQVQQQQSQHDAHLMTYANLCHGSSSTATAADG